MLTIRSLISVIESLPPNHSEGDALIAELLSAGRALTRTADTPEDAADLIAWAVFTSDVEADQIAALKRAEMIQGQCG